jgi:glyoxylase I family protein
MINGIHHTAISTPDIEGAMNFYCNLLGAEIITEYSWPKGQARADEIVGLKNSSAKVALLRLGNAMIELFEYASPSPQSVTTLRPVCDHGITHICIDVSDINFEYDRLSKAGMKFNCPPQNLGHYHATYGRDPDGNFIELQEVIDGNSKYSISQSHSRKNRHA